MFQFKQFKIIQKKSGMKVGTDGVLLGAWTNCRNATKILDIGAGTGLISIMLAQKKQTAFVTGIEIDTTAYKEALTNIENCKWAERITIKNSSIQTYSQKTEERFDLIVSNPPFFHQSLKSHCIARTIARHSESLNFDDLLTSVKKLLTPNGKFCVILPYSDSEIFTDKAQRKFELFCQKKCAVKPTPHKEPKRILLEFSTNETENCILEELIIEKQRHDYTEKYKNLTKDFYLKF